MINIIKRCTRELDIFKIIDAIPEIGLRCATEELIYPTLIKECVVPLRKELQKNDTHAHAFIADQYYYGGDMMRKDYLLREEQVEPASILRFIDKLCEQDHAYEMIKNCNIFGDNADHIFSSIDKYCERMNAIANCIETAKNPIVTGSLTAVYHRADNENVFLTFSLSVNIKNHIYDEEHDCYHDRFICDQLLVQKSFMWDFGAKYKELEHAQTEDAYEYAYA